MQKYEQLRNNLIDMLEDLDDRLSKITQDVKHVNGPISPDFEEQAIETQNDEVLDAIGNSTRNEIVKIKQALTRMDKGEYGICQVCGEAINKERLKAVPYSSMCIKCATQAEGC